MLLELDPSGFLSWQGIRRPCALGKAGITSTKREGDHATPRGLLPLRRAWYRPDRLAAPATALPLWALSPSDGWCDDPADPAYNCPVTLPYPGRHELMWRDDHVYDLGIVLGWNDDPVQPGQGSAIFLHLARPGFPGTEGCVALEQAAMLELLAACSPGDLLRVP